MDLLLFLFAMVLLLLLKGFFSGSEIALVNSDKLKMHHQANQGNRGAQLVLKLFQTPDVLLGTTLVGTNISVVVLTTLGTLLSLAGVAFLHPDWILKLLLIGVFLLFTNPLSSQVLARAAHRTDVQKASSTELDRLEEDLGGKR